VSAMRIAVLGATATGKSRLAHELTLHLPALHISDDPPLATVQHGDFRLILLTGLDLPDSTEVQHAADAGLRAALDQAGLAYGVVYGLGPQRLRSALRLIEPQQELPSRWTGVCEKCADPECEFRLFTGLKNSTAAALPPS